MGTTLEYEILNFLTSAFSMYLIGCSQLGEFNKAYQAHILNETLKKKQVPENRGSCNKQETYVK